MPNIEDLQSEIQSLQEQVSRLETTLKDHKHLGIDGSALFSDDTKFRGRELIMAGSGNTGSTPFTPITVLDGTGQRNEAQRGFAAGLAIVGTKGESTEQDNMILGVGKTLNDIALPQLPANPAKNDWSVLNGNRVRFIHSPQSVASGSLPPLSFLVAERTPFFTSTGTLTNGGNTLTDSNANFATDILKNCIIYITGGEAYRIISNTATVISIALTDTSTTANGAWAASSGTYTYNITTPSLLGEAGTPFYRGFFQEIRLGYGASGGTQVCYIKQGIGTPESVVTAPPGSLFLDKSGGKLYVKESGTSNTGWVIK